MSGDTSFDATAMLTLGLEATANSYHLACCGVQAPLTMREWRLIQALHHLARGSRSAGAMRAEAVQALAQWRETLGEGQSLRPKGRSLSLASCQPSSGEDDRRDPQPEAH